MHRDDNSKYITLVHIVKAVNFTLPADVLDSVYQSLVAAPLAVSAAADLSLWESQKRAIFDGC